MEIGIFVCWLGAFIGIFLLGVLAFHVFTPKANIQLGNKIISVKDAIFFEKKPGDEVRIGYVDWGKERLYSISEERDKTSRIGKILHIKKGVSIGNSSLYLEKRPGWGRFFLLFKCSVCSS